MYTQRQIRNANDDDSEPRTDKSESTAKYTVKVLGNIISINT